MPECRVLLVAIAVLFASSSDGLAQERLVIGSKPFTENRILAEVMAQLVEARTDIEVEIQDSLPGTLAVFAALRGAEIDVYPEYTGTAWVEVLGREAKAEDPLETYVLVAREYERRFDIVWLPPFGFSNSFALALRGDLARELGVRSVSELVPHGPGLNAGVSHEFLGRDDGWPGVSAAYGLEFAEIRGMQHGLAFEALQAGEIDVLDAWTTDGKLRRYDVRVLHDDRAFWPPYHCAPIVRSDALARHPRLRDVLGELAFRIPDERMQELNHQVEIGGRSYRDVAHAFLVEEQLVGPLARTDLGAAPGERRGSWLDFVLARGAVTAKLAAYHVALSGGAVLLAALLAVPLGVLLTRRRRLAAPVLTVAGVIQTVPSLALLAFMIPILGLGLDAAYAALILYALLPILRNTYAGLLDVDPELVEAARGLGLRPRQILRRIELPLAARTIMAGIRTATVMSIGVATLVSFIGAPSLGDPIVTGLQLNDTRLVLAGAVPAALLAIAADFVLERFERRLAPWASGTSRG